MFGKLVQKLVENLDQNLDSKLEQNLVGFLAIDVVKGLVYHLAQGLD